MSEVWSGIANHISFVLTNISVPTRVAASTTSNPLHTSPIASAVVFPCSSVIQLMIEWEKHAVTFRYFIIQQLTKQSPHEYLFDVKSVHNLVTIVDDFVQVCLTMKGMHLWLPGLLYSIQMLLIRAHTRVDCSLMGHRLVSYYLVIVLYSYVQCQLLGVSSQSSARWVQR